MGMQAVFPQGRKIQEKASPHNHTDFNLAGPYCHCYLCTVPSTEAPMDPGLQRFLRIIKTGIVFPRNSVSLI